MSKTSWIISSVHKKKYFWGCLSFMVQTGAGGNNIFMQEYQIMIELIGIEKFGVNVLPNTLEASVPLNLATGAQEVQNFYDSVCSYMIAKEIEVSITNISPEKLRIHCEEY